MLAIQKSEVVLVSEHRNERMQVLLRELWKVRVKIMCGEMNERIIEVVKEFQEMWCGRCELVV